MMSSYSTASGVDLRREKVTDEFLRLSATYAQQHCFPLVFVSHLVRREVKPSRST